MAGMRVLTFSSLFPSDARPRHGIFVETRLAHLVRDTDVDACVIAPVPWFPFRSPRFGAYAHFAATPRRAVRPNGLRVSYPRYLMVPKFGVARQPDRMAHAAWPDVQALLGTGWRPDLVDAHYLYPDGVAAAQIAGRLGVPYLMTARGTDVNVIAHLPGPGARIMRAAEGAAAVIAVSSALRDQLVALGVDAAKITVLRNGVDIDTFRIEDRETARAALGLPPAVRLAACVGNLLPEKDQGLALEMIASRPGLRLVLVGDGPRRAELGERAASLGIADRVDFRSAMPQRELSRLYAAADVLLVTSQREGWPNVVLEAMACGTPVVAFDVGAVRQMIVDDSLGRVVTERSASALGEGVDRVLAMPARREDLRAHASGFDWTSISRGQFELFERALRRADASAAR